jgi:hypothetical protein
MSCTGFVSTGGQQQTFCTPGGAVAAVDFPFLPQFCCAYTLAITVMPLCRATCLTVRSFPAFFSRCMQLD